MRSATGEKNVDRRVRRSRRAMLSAFDQLIMTTPLEKITVSEIAREADVDRKTFYQHFGTVDGLLDAVAEDAVTELLDEMERLMGEQAATGEKPNPLAAFHQAISDRLSRDLPLSEGYCEHVPPELLLEHLVQPLIRQALDRGFIGEGVSDDRLKALLSFGLGGLFTMYRWWLSSDRAMSLEELTMLAFELTEAGSEQYVRS